MPQVHTYIRNEDMEKWRALENKSEFIHNALNPPEIITKYAGKEVGRRPAKMIPEPVEDPAFKPIPKVAGVTQGVKYCKEGHIADEFGRCQTKGCKYSR